jgi:putative SOS response-associated peptidase YedK
MCGRYSITTPTEALRRLFDFSGHPNLGPNYNVAPTSIVPLVRLNKSGRELAMARWGFIPSWTKEVRTKPLINARAETVAEKPSFRGAFKYRRCLVPADGYFEWQKSDDGSKQPWHIHRADHRPFGMAGIWETYLDRDGTELDTLAILTSAANDKLAALHNRMPVIIPPDQFDRWMGTDPKAAGSLVDLLQPTQSDFFTAYPVDKRVGRVGQDDADIVKPIGPGLDDRVSDTENVDSEGASREKGDEDDQLSLL